MHRKGGGLVKNFPDWLLDLECRFGYFPSLCASSLVILVNDTTAYTVNLTVSMRGGFADRKRTT